MHTARTTQPTSTSKSAALHMQGSERGGTVELLQQRHQAARHRQVRENIRPHLAHRTGIALPYTPSLSRCILTYRHCLPILHTAILCAEGGRWLLLLLCIEKWPRQPLLFYLLPKIPSRRALHCCLLYREIEPESVIYYAYKADCNLS
jgi:hypothetical protein